MQKQRQIKTQKQYIQYGKKLFLYLGDYYTHAIVVCRSDLTLQLVPRNSVRLASGSKYV